MAERRHGVHRVRQRGRGRDCGGLREGGARLPERSLDEEGQEESEQLGSVVDPQHPQRVDQPDLDDRGPWGAGDVQHRRRHQHLRISLPERPGQEGQGPDEARPHPAVQGEPEAHQVLRLGGVSKADRQWGNGARADSLEPLHVEAGHEARGPHVRNHHAASELRLRPGDISVQGQSGQSLGPSERGRAPDSLSLQESCAEADGHPVRPGARSADHLGLQASHMEDQSADHEPGQRRDPQHSRRRRPLQPHLRECRDRCRGLGDDRVEAADGAADLLLP
mmetsp:Transcript_8809/g.29405  ORF Transcript_8809/g.29405 Transcript_8809/m.29405 type:complete len:279 (+) Transcript_8809:1156-1992(+)